MTQEQVLKAFLLGAGFQQDNDDAVIIGITVPILAPQEGVFLVMQKHTAEVDTVLQKMPQGTANYMRLLSYRGFTFQEYLALYDLSIKQKDFAGYPIFQCLYIRTEHERRRWFYLYPEKSYEHYTAMLAKSLQVFGSNSLSHFFLEAFCNGSFVTSPPQ